MVNIWLVVCVAESDEITVPDILFDEFVLDISDDIQQYASHEDNNTAVNHRLYSNGNISHSLAEETDVGNLSASALEEAAAASAKPDRHFNLFKEAMASNSSQVYYQIYWYW